MAEDTAKSTRTSDEIDLIAVSGPDEFKRARSPIDKPATIGRSKDCAIVLNESSVSREHASIYREDGKFYVRDLESRAGIAVNMMFLEKGDTQQLYDRDLITVGPWKLLVRLGEERSDDSEVETVDGLDESMDATASADTPAPSESEVSDAKPDKESKPTGKSTRSDSVYATRASIFIRLRADGSLDRELGWQEFTEKYARVIAGFARNAGLRAQDADDVLQDVLLGFFRVSEQFEYNPERGRFRGYLKRVTLNAIRARHRRKRPSTFLKDDYDPPGEMPDVDAAWDRQWTEQLLQRAMTEARGGVEERTWKAFELYGVRGVPVEQVSTELEMTPAAIRHAKMRLVKQVREIVDRLRVEEG
ncbi:MAG: sigma-70 family RNA polymerase sigma factor [Planctomycetota bacterium]|nr:sigma-70 family RNA polymerase sigma factor [Planctomycetota bacterium]